MMEFLSDYAPRCYAVMRIAMGALFLSNGIQNLFGVASPENAVLSVITGPIGLTAGLIELIGGTLVMLGLFTRPAALLCSGLMAVEMLQWMWTILFKDMSTLRPMWLAITYLAVFTFISAKGAGIWSLDRIRDINPAPGT